MHFLQLLYVRTAAVEVECDPLFCHRSDRWAWVSQSRVGNRAAQQVAHQVEQYADCTGPVRKGSECFNMGLIGVTGSVRLDDSRRAPVYHRSPVHPVHAGVSCAVHECRVRVRTLGRSETFATSASCRQVAAVNRNSRPAAAACHPGAAPGRTALAGMTCAAHNPQKLS